MTSPAPLENFAKFAASSPRNCERLKARNILRDITSNKRTRGCGLALGQNVRVRGSEGTGFEAGVAGLATCGSVWVCPVCASKIATRRTDELEGAIAHWAAHGNSFVMLTLTMQHRKGQRLRTLWDGVSVAWRSFVSDRASKEARSALGVDGYHRTTEVTLGANGWHVHFHVLYFVQGKPGDLMSVARGGELVSRWIHSVDRAGFSAVSDAQDWKILRGSDDALSSIAAYVTKGQYREVVGTVARKNRSIAMEMTRGDLKSARKAGSRTPYELLADIVDSIEATGEIPEDDFALWQEWEEASKGRRQQVWSRGLRERMGLEDALTDDEAAALEVEGVDLVEISASEWKRLTADPTAHAELIAVVEAAGSNISGRIAAADWLTRRGIKFRVVFPEIEGS